MEKLIEILRPFYEITEMLSKHDASISMAIPAVTLILDSLEENRNKDMGVLGYKRELKAEMLEMFEDMETEEHYIVSTLLDSRFKSAFFREPGTEQNAQLILLEKLTEHVREVMTPNQTSTNTTTGATHVTAKNNWVVGNLMEARVAKSKARSQCVSESDAMRRIAQKAIDDYLSLPLSGYEESTFKFWKEYSISGGTGQRCLADLARHYLTPPPTSTDIERLGCNSIEKNLA